MTIFYIHFHAIRFKKKEFTNNNNEDFTFNKTNHLSSRYGHKTYWMPHKYGKVSFIVLVPEWVVDEGGAEGYRSFIVDCHAVVRAQVDGLVQEHDELGNTVT